MHTHLILSKKWADLKWRPDHTIDSFMGEIAQLHGQHKSANVPINDETAFVKLISSLLQLFKTEALIMEDWNKPDLDQVRALFLKHQDAVWKRKFKESNPPLLDV